MDNSDNGNPPFVSGPINGAMPDPGEPGGDGPDPGRPNGGPDPGKIVLAVNSVIAAVGGTFASTHSIAAIVVAGCAGLACAVVIARKR